MKQDTKTLLAFDTTGKGTSLSLYNQGHLYTHSLPDGGSQLQSSELVPALLNLCQQHHVFLHDITTLLTFAGPGSFTGIRLGLATAIGLKIGLKCETFAPSSLHVMAYKTLKQYPDHPCLVLIDTHREDFYGLLVDESMNELSPSQIYTHENIQQLRSSISHLTVASNMPNSSFDEISLNASDLIDYHLNGPQHQDWSSLTPYYVRTPEFVKQKRFQNENS